MSLSENPEQPYILVIGTAEWDQAIATNQHYVVRELCRGGFAKVDYVESLGLRKPELSTRDLKRIWGRARRVFGRGDKQASGEPGRPRPRGLTVLSPLVLPIHNILTRALNRRLLQHAVNNWIRYRGPRVLWTYSPVTYGLEAYSDQSIYHCVDLLGKVPGINEKLIETGEKSLAGKRVIPIATSQVVQSHLQSTGFSNVVLWENVADIAPFAAARGGTQDGEQAVGRHVEHPSAIFAGNLAPNKVDFDLLIALSKAGVQVRIAGPHAEGGGSDADGFARLMGHGVDYLGMLTLSQLAGRLVESSVGLIPYRVNEYTKGVSPLKTYEYLAAGIPVVSTPIPSVREQPNHIRVAHDEQSFIAAVKAFLDIPSSEAVLEDRRVIAARHSWGERGEQIRTLVGHSHASGDFNL